MIRLWLCTPAARMALDGLLQRQFDADLGVVWQLDGRSVELPLDAYQLQHAIEAERRALAADLAAHLPQGVEGVGPDPRMDTQHQMVVRRVEGLTDLLGGPSPAAGHSLRMAS